MKAGTCLHVSRHKNNFGHMPLLMLPATHGLPAGTVPRFTGWKSRCFIINMHAHTCLHTWKSGLTVPESQIIPDFQDTCIYKAHIQHLMRWKNALFKLQASVQNYGIFLGVQDLTACNSIQPANNYRHIRNRKHCSANSRKWDNINSPVFRYTLLVYSHKHTQ